MDIFAAKNITHKKVFLTGEKGAENSFDRKVRLLLFNLNIETLAGD